MRSAGVGIILGCLMGHIEHRQAMIKQYKENVQIYSFYRHGSPARKSFSGSSPKVPMHDPHERISKTP